MPSRILTQNLFLVLTVLLVSNLELDRAGKNLSVCSMNFGFKFKSRSVRFLNRSSLEYQAAAWPGFGGSIRDQAEK